MQLIDSETAKVPAEVAPPEAEEGAEQDIGLAKRFFNLKTLASFAVAFLILYLLMRNVKMDIGATIQTIGSANLGLYAVGFVIYYLGFPIRGLRWQRMLANAKSEDDPAGRPMTLSVLTQIIYVSWFANCLVPAKLGDLVRAYMLKREGSVRVLKGMGTILAERLLDLAVLLVLLSVAGMVSMRDKLPPDVSHALELGFVLVGVAGLGLLAMRQLDALVQRFVPARFQERYTRFHEGALRSFRDFPFILAMTLLAWLAEAGRLVFVTWSLGVHLSPDLPTELLMITFIALASAALTALPVTPAGLGLVEALIVKAFAWTAAASGVQIANETVWSVAILDRSISYGSIVVLGTFVYILSRRK
ncbi:MAG: lysylphosphatidylglycerol synthase transmembrane domain-containing protein [Chloroflexota bacterium]